ncbi:peptidase family C78-domain-containing protein [Dactylonectria estremocensis]|uniref:Peptidase family C78-domain-containing protein n=1 Tax=Dactylonectria estremocensis TaxID=1079267 RepID=A0A9P9F2T1_9HYPO|nr:peptidase family C78-domain-containing protein [Dactylonectria estremocensis]
MANPESTTSCPFCGFKSSQGDYELLLHIETRHPEGDAPFAIDEGTVLCPQDGCGEMLSQDEIAYHLELHDLEAKEDVTDSSEQLPAGVAVAISPSDKPRRDETHRRRREKQKSTIEAWKALFGGQKSRHSQDTSHRTRHKSKKLPTTESPLGDQISNDNATDHAGTAHSSQKKEKGRGIARLGKSELGRFAHENQMPPWLIELLQQEGQVINDGVMPVLGQLLEQSPSTQYAYLCHPEVQHVSKLRREGGFCGYRNIQMLISHIIGARSTGADLFGSTFPTIFEVQDLIENAWDMGFNAQGRVETGGVKGTRKYIGTPEAQAVFCSLSIPCSVQAFKDKERGKAKSLLLQGIENYFQGGIVDVEARIHLTGLPPIYLQHPGHSLTIVGIEKQMDGEVNLLVFDPSFRDSTKIRHLVGKVFRHKLSTVDEAVQPYRRGAHYLRKYSEFEVLYLTSNATTA